MNPYLKAAMLKEESADRKHINETALLPLEGREGYVFLMIDIHGRNTQPTEFIASVTEHAERLANSVGAEANIQHRFEQFLSALNQTLSERVAQGDFSIPINQINALVGIASSNQMFLSGTGDLVALFLHRTKEQRYQVFNLFRSIQTEQSLPTWEKAFAVVLDGDLTSGDVFCVSNKDLARQLAQEELNSILSTIPPTGAVEKIRQYFPTETNVSLIVIQSSETKLIPDEIAQPLASVSIHELDRTKTDTRKLLEDQKPKPSSKVMMKILRVFLKSTWAILMKYTRVLTQKTYQLTRKEHRERIVKTVKTTTDSRLKQLIATYKGLPKSSKTLALASVGIVFVLVIGISVLRNAQARSAELTAYQKQVTQVEEMIEKADGAVIYKDETQARKLYTQALALAAALPQETEERKAKSRELTEQINGAFDTLRHLVTIPSPNLAGEIMVTDGSVGKSLFMNEGIVSILLSNKKLAVLDSSKKSISLTETKDGGAGIPLKTTTEDGTVLILDDRPGITRLDVQNAQMQITNVKPSEGTRWTDIALYNSKLYVIEPKSGQLIRYNRAGNDFDGGTRWIKALSTDLSDAVSLSIDATVFVLKQNGKIVRFVSGSEVGWSQASVDPAITSATDIWTNAESAYVYVLEPSTERLIVYKKEGGDLVTQYRSDAFEGVSDFLVDEPSKTIYFLVGTKLYSISASHLK